MKKSHRGSKPFLSQALGGQENGQIVVLAAFAFLIVLGFAALSIDVGLWLHTKTKIQADVDAMALAGAQTCSNGGCEASAIVVAKEFAPKNKVLLEEVQFIRTESGCFGDCSQPTDCDAPADNHVTVQVMRTEAPLLAQLFHVGPADIVACATAIAPPSTERFAVTGFGQGVRPFALDKRCMEASPGPPARPAVVYGSPVILKFDSDGKNNCQTQQGNFAAIRIDGSGASVYENTIKHGSQSPVCTDTTPDCCPTYGSDLCIGAYGVYTLPTEPGNMVGKTRTGIDFLIANTPGNCDTWAEVQTFDSEIGEAVLNPDCIPWAPGYTAAGTRVLIIPVVTGLWGGGGGNHPVIIKKFAIVFLDGYSGSCSGNSCDIQARFIRSTVNAEWVSAKSECGASPLPACPDTTIPPENVPAKITR